MFGGVGMTKKEYLAAVSEQIQCDMAKPLVLKELDAHIEDQKEFFLQSGREEEEAEIIAVMQMGDPVETGTKLDHIHRPKTDWALPIMAIAIAIFGIVMQCIIFQYWNNVVADESYGKKTIIYNLVGIAVMSGLFFFDYRVISKYIWQIYLVFIVGCGIWFLFFNGSGIFAKSFATGNSALMLSVLFFVGFVYHFREEKGIGILKSIGIMILNMMLLAYIFEFLSISVWFVVQSTCMIVIFAAMAKGVYGGNKKLQMGSYLFIVIGGISAFVAELILAEGRHIGMAAYQLARLRAMFHPNEFADGANFIGNNARQQISGATLFGDKTLGAFEYLGGVECEYVLTCTFSYFGIIVASILLLVIGIFLLRTFHISIKQKNKLGFLLGIAASSMLIIKSVFSIGANLGVLPPSGVDMPFLSFGFGVTMVNYIYLGLILSVYRYSSVFGEFEKGKSLKFKI